MIESAPTAFLFDLDGLLLDTEPIHGRAWSTAARHFGTELSDAQLLSLRGRRRQDCAEQVDRWLSEPVGAKALLEIQQPCARALLPQAPAMPGAQDLVRFGYDNGLSMALVTSSSEQAVAFKTQPHPWLQLIETRIYGDDPDLSRGKPDPQPFLLAAQRLGCPVDRCWAFEDSDAGMTAALAAGCLVWVLQPEADDQLAGNPKRISTLHTPINQLISRAG
ncbi:MAG: HAD family hydrolase [Synechococcus sp.]